MNGNRKQNLSVYHYYANLGFHVTPRHLTIWSRFVFTKTLINSYKWFLSTVLPCSVSITLFAITFIWGISSAMDIIYLSRNHFFFGGQKHKSKIFWNAVARIYVLSFLLDSPISSCRRRGVKNWKLQKKWTRSKRIRFLDLF